MKSVQSLEKKVLAVCVAYHPRRDRLTWHGGRPVDGRSGDREARHCRPAQAGVKAEVEGRRRRSVTRLCQKTKIT